MRAQDILERSDALFAAGKGAEAVALLESSYEQARQEGDWQTRLTLVNELMGYWRAASRFDRAWAYVDEARQLLEEHDIARTLAGVTTVLNIATVFRADRKPKEALALYREVEQVYLAEGLQADYRLGPKSFLRSMKRKSFCTRRQRKLLTSWAYRRSRQRKAWTRSMRSC